MSALTTPSWVNPFITFVEGNVGKESFAISLQDGIQVTASASDEEIELAIDTMNLSKAKHSSFRTMLDRWIGQLICEYAARKGTSWAEAISNLNLCEKTGMTYETIEKLPSMVTKNLPESFTLVNLTTGHFKAVAQFGGPEEIEKKGEWMDRCHSILTHASENPEKMGRGWVEQQMRELQVEFGIKKAKRATNGGLQTSALAVADMLLNWSDDDFEIIGITRGVARDHWEQMRGELVERDIISELESSGSWVCPW